MATTYSPSLKLTLIGDGEQSGTWGQTTNNNFGALVEQAITGITTITMANTDYTLNSLNGVVDESRSAIIIAVSSQNHTGIHDIIAPATNKLYVIKNLTSGGYAIRIKTSAIGGAAVTIPNGAAVAVYCSGADFYEQISGSGASFYVNNNLIVGGNGTISGTLSVTGSSSFTGNISGTTASFSGAISSVSPSFSGIPVVPTALPGTVSYQAASTEFVGTAIFNERSASAILSNKTISGTSNSITNVSLSSGVTGTLPVGNGGTGQVTLASGALLLGNGGSGIATLSGVSIGQIPQWDGAKWGVGSLPGGGVTNVTASAPLASSGGTTPDISITTPITVGYGGTGVSSFNTAGFVKAPGGNVALTSVSKVDLSSDVTGALSTTNGGTGLSGANPFTSNRAVYSTSTSALTTGTLPVAAGGTGTSATPVNGQLLIGNTATQSYSLATLTQGTNVTITNGAGTVSIAAAGSVSSVGISAPALFTVSNSPVTGSGTLTLTYSGTALPVANGGTGVISAPTSGQLLIGNGTGYTLATLTQGTGITITNTAGAISIANAGVTAFSTGTTGLSVNASTGSITLSGTLSTGNGGTGLTTFTAANKAIYSTSASALTAGTLPVAAGGTGATTLTGYVKGSGTANFTASSTIPSTDITGLGTLATANSVNLGTQVSGTLGVSNGGTGSSTLDGAGIVTKTDTQTITGAKTFDSFTYFNPSNLASRNVVIGASSVVGSLNWNLYCQSQTNNPAGVFYGVSAASDALFLIKNGSGTVINFGFGTVGSYTTGFGSITTDGSSVAYNTSSDYRLKENVVTLSGAASRLLQLKPVRFNWKANPSLGTIDGFLAHEVSPVVPEAIIGEKDAVDEKGNIKPQNIDPSKLIPLLTAALQEALKRIETLEADVAALKGA